MREINPEHHVSMRRRRMGLRLDRQSDPHLTCSYQEKKMLKNIVRHVLGLKVGLCIQIFEKELITIHVADRHDTKDNDCSVDILETQPEVAQIDLRHSSTRGVQWDATENVGK